MGIPCAGVRDARSCGNSCISGLQEERFCSVGCYVGLGDTHHIDFLEQSVVVASNLQSHMDTTQRTQAVRIDSR